MPFIGFLSILIGLSLSAQSYLHFFIRVAQILILISTLIYIPGGFFIYKLNNCIRRLTVMYSSVLVICLTPISIFLFFNPWGWGGLYAALLLPFIIFPLIFVFILTRPKVKEQFK